MTTGRLDFGDLIETVGVERLQEILTGSTYLAAVISTLPEKHKAMIIHMLVGSLNGPEDGLPVLTRFMIELVANSIGNKKFSDWARSEITNSVN